MTNKMTNEDFNEFCDLRQDIMEHKSVSFYEATVIASNFFVKGIKPNTKEFDEEMRNVKTLWED